jgi:predicted transcriptional regulator
MENKSIDKVYVLFNNNIYLILKEINSLSFMKSKINYRQTVIKNTNLSTTCVIHNLDILKKNKLVKEEKIGRVTFLNLLDKGKALLNIYEEVKKFENEK